MLLGVNVDHVATVRQARGGNEPDPLLAALLAIKGGADGITVHLREDRRHIQDRDLIQVRRRVKNVELNLEMAAVKEMTDIALKVRPDMVTLVPEKRAELTTEGGLNLRENKRRIGNAVRIIQEKKIPVSLFINPSVKDIQIAREIRAAMVEIHTGFFADSRGKKQMNELMKVKDAISAALDIGLMVNAGHGLNYTNVKKIAAIEGIRGLYIGHSIVARSVYDGMEKAVKDMKRLIEK